MQLLYPAVKLVSGVYRKSPSGRTLWCGPFALSVITGLPYDATYAKALDVEKRRIRALNRAYYRNRGIKNPKGPYSVPTSLQGMHEDAFARTAERLGVKVKWTHLRKDTPTLLTFARDHTVKDHVYVLVAGNHFEVICNGILYHSHHDPVAIEDAPAYRMARVTSWADVKVRPEAIATEASAVREPTAFVHKFTRELRPALSAAPIPTQG
jgi:hypothetical protein